MRYLYMEQIIIFYCQYRAASHAKQAVLIPKPVLFLLATQCPGVCCPLETIFLVILKFNCWWETFIPLQKMLSLDFLKGLEWWLMMSHLDEVIQVATSSSAVGKLVIFFLDRWEMFVLHPSTKTPTAVKHFWILLIDDWSCFVWMSFFKLQPGLQL